MKYEALLARLEQFHIRCDNFPVTEKGCRIYPTSHDKNGYPIVNALGKKYRANRLRLEKKLGRSILSGYEACHTCDNPSCVELAHLFEGTSQQNSDDMKAKGRSNAARGSDHYMSLKPALGTASEQDIQRFMGFVEKTTSGCWFWAGARSRGKGNTRWYGSFHYAGKTVRAHRFACEQIAKKPLPPGYDRDHLCRFSLCVNPDHFEIVTKEINQARRHIKNPPVTLHYEYINGELELSLKMISDSVGFDFTEPQNRLIVRADEPENPSWQNAAHPPIPLAK